MKTYTYKHTLLPVLPRGGSLTVKPSNLTKEVEEKMATKKHP